MVALCKYNFPIFHQEFDVTRDAKANLKNWNFEKKSCKPVWNFVTVFEKKNFFREFSRNFEIPENFKTQFSTCAHRDTMNFNSSNERGENLLQENEKKLGGGGGRNRVKFHFEDFENFKSRKMPGISEIS